MLPNFGVPSWHTVESVFRFLDGVGSDDDMSHYDDDVDEDEHGYATQCDCDSSGCDDWCEC